MKLKTLSVACFAVLVVALAAFWSQLFGQRPEYAKLPKAEAETRAKQLALAFAKFGTKVQVTWDDQFVYVACDGIPSHDMMKDITAWNQQVPVPQPYKGKNAFKLPLQPILNAKPAPTTKKGPIAVAANGVPIFNPTTGNGIDDPYVLGELDEFGGHCGKADDYHYHIAPLFLSADDPARPIGYGLDGYPILGEKEADGTPHDKLDAAHGHADGKGGYHYHGTKTYPYVMGGFQGAVDLKNQPKTKPFRPEGKPIKATILECKAVGGNKYALKYQAKGAVYQLHYTINQDETYTFEYVDSAGNSTTQTYSRKK